jgi:glutamate dehydrogenase
MTLLHFAELAAYAQEHAGAANKRQGNFITAYFTNTDPDEIRIRGAASLYAQANAHWRLLQSSRKQNTPKIRVFNPSMAEDGFVSEHTVIQIVNDNMPFLVDSVTMAINRSGRTAHWIVHPLMSVVRNSEGGAESVSTVAEAKASGTSNALESLIMVE